MSGLEPLAALGVASNVIQLVDFAVGLVADTSDIYKSAAGASGNSRTLEAIAQDASRLSDAIKLFDECPATLQALAVEAKEVADELLKTVKRLQVSGRRRIWSSFMLALKETWNSKKIEAFAGRLEKLQSQLTSHIQFLVL